MDEKKISLNDSSDHSILEKAVYIEVKKENTKDSKPPFNDVMDHFDKIEGNAYNIVDTNFKGLPKPIRYIGYFMFAIVSITFIILIILSLLH